VRDEPIGSEEIKEIGVGKGDLPGAPGIGADLVGVEGEEKCAGGEVEAGEVLGPRGGAFNDGGPEVDVEAEVVLGLGEQGGGALAGEGVQVGGAGGGASSAGGGSVARQAASSNRKRRER